MRCLVSAAVMRRSRWSLLRWRVCWGERVAEGVPVEVVGVADDELAERGEVAFDRVEVAGVGRCCDELDPVRGRVGADRRYPVGGEVVLDPVDALAVRVGEPDSGA